jgi:hypothetical protein
MRSLAGAILLWYDTYTTYGRYIMDLILLAAGIAAIVIVTLGLAAGALLLLAAFIGAPAGEYDFDLSDDDLL